MQVTGSAAVEASDKPLWNQRPLVRALLRAFGFVEWQENAGRDGSGLDRRGGTDARAKIPPATSGFGRGGPRCRCVGKTRTNPLAKRADYHEHKDTRRTEGRHAADDVGQNPPRHARGDDGRRDAAGGPGVQRDDPRAIQPVARGPAAGKGGRPVELFRPSDSAAPCNSARWTFWKARCPCARSMKPGLTRFGETDAAVSAALLKGELPPAPASTASDAPLKSALEAVERMKPEPEIRSLLESVKAATVDEAIQAARDRAAAFDAATTPISRSVDRLKKPSRLPDRQSWFGTLLRRACGTPPLATRSRPA